MNLVPLFEEALEFQDYNGTVLSDGKVAVYYIGRTRLADIYEDVDGSVPAENPRVLNNLGMGPVYVNPAFDYEMVVFDAYGSELFSVKKYLASKGEHSTANVVVTPSESIAVSAWTVGDVQVYMPYLTGQLGKVYEGIDPIVVNNQVDKISANHVPLGVQDPLYFVQDDEEACIIGFSGETLPEGTMNESAFGYQDGQITSYNGSAFSAGNSYEAGSYIDIDGNTISVTGLTPVPADTASTGLVAQVSADITAMIPDTSDMATQTWVNEQGFLTAHQDISNKLDTTAFSTVSGDFLTAIPSEYITENTLQSGLSSKLDSTAFSTVSGNFLTAVPEGYATENWVTSQGYLTEHQSLDGLMSASLLESSGGLITGYNGSAFAGQGGGVTGDFELSAGSGISIVDFPLEQKTVISVTAQGGNPEVEQAVIDNSATWDSVTAKADVTAIPSTAGLATEDWVTGQGYITNDAITGKQDITGMTAYQPAGDYLTTGDSANFATTGDIEDLVSAISETYQPITAMTAYQAAGDYLTTADSAEFYTTANDSGFITNDAITGKQDITGMTAYQPVGDYVQGSDLSLNSYDKISAISGHEIAVEELPEGVMVESGLEYNAVNEISAYNGSAIAQYGAEKQWLVHDDTLVHAANSAQYALGVNVSAVQTLMGLDETVLFFAGNDSSGYQSGNLTESIKNFETIKVIGMDNDAHIDVKYIYPQWTHDADNGTANIAKYEVMFYGTNPLQNTVWEKWVKYSFSALTAFTVSLGYAGSYTANQISDVTNDHKFSVRKVIGIGRKEV